MRFCLQEAPLGLARHELRLNGAEVLLDVREDAQIARAPLARDQVLAPLELFGDRSDLPGTYGHSCGRDNAGPENGHGANGLCRQRRELRAVQAVRYTNPRAHLVL
jgi:hypothetical protein